MGEDQARRTIHLIRALLFGDEIATLNASGMEALRNAVAALDDTLRSVVVGLVADPSEHRLSGEQPRTARADHAAGSRSSDGSDTPPIQSGEQPRPDDVERVRAILAKGREIFASYMGDPDGKDDWETAFQEEAEYVAGALSASSKLREALDDLQKAESTYRYAHDILGAGDPKTGRAWDLMRRAGNKARDALGTEAAESGR